MRVPIPTPLRQYTEKQPSVELGAGTVGQALAGLVSRHGGLRQQLFTPKGRLRAFVNVYLNDDDIRYLQQENTPLRQSDEIYMVPSIAGGMRS